MQCCKGDIGRREVDPPVLREYSAQRQAELEVATTCVYQHANRRQLACACSADEGDR